MLIIWLQYVQCVHKTKLALYPRDTCRVWCAANPQTTASVRQICSSYCQDFHHRCPPLRPYLKNKIITWGGFFFKRKKEQLRNNFIDMKTSSLKNKNLDFWEKWWKGHFPTPTPSDSVYFKNFVKKLHLILLGSDPVGMEHRYWGLKTLEQVVSDVLEFCGMAQNMDCSLACL